MHCRGTLYETIYVDTDTGLNTGLNFQVTQTIELISLSQVREHEFGSVGDGWKLNKSLHTYA